MYENGERQRLFVFLIEPKIRCWVCETRQETETGDKGGLCGTFSGV